MEIYLQNFIDEITVLLSDLEKNIFKFENDPKNNNQISEILRNLHTIKGASGIFDFKKVELLTHNIESIYNSLKTGKITYSVKIINLTFKFIDFINISLENNITDNELEKKKDDILQAIQEFVEIKISLKTENENGGIEQTFLIIFKPNADFEQRGVILENIIKATENIGTSSVFQKVNSAELIEKENKFYMFWNILLSTKSTEQDINDLFLFVIDEVEIIKIADTNLFEDTNLIKKISTEIENSNINNSSELNLFLNENNINIIQKKIEKNEKSKNTEKINTRDLIAHKTDTIRVSSKKLDELMNSISELISTKETIHLLAKESGNINLKDVSKKLERLSRDIQNNALDMRLIPIDSILGQFKKLIRELSQNLSKEIKFETDGTETELDKTIADGIIEPLLHIFRNSIDHGIELPEERLLNNKPKKGRIKFYASHSGNNVIIQIHDDGQGIDDDFIYNKAVEQHLITPNINLSKQEKIDLIFLPNFTTSSEVTNVSGRGIGMDIVRKKIQELNGEINIDSEKGLGTYVTIKLPLTLSIIDTLLVQINKKNYLIPRYIIYEINKLTISELNNIKNNVILKNKELLPIINLNKRFGNNKYPQKTINIITVTIQDKNYGLTVDKILGEYQAVIKPLGELFKNKNSFSGASILGDGSLALMIDTQKLIQKHNLKIWKIRF